MPRPAALHPKVRFHVTLSQELYGRILLRLTDPLSETGVPLGALSAFFEDAAAAKLAHLESVDAAARQMLKEKLR